MPPLAVNGVKPVIAAPSVKLCAVVSAVAVIPAVTFSVAAVLEVLPLNVAVMVVGPMLNPVATPLFVTVATAVLVEFQATDPEILPVLLSE